MNIIKIADRIQVVNYYKYQSKPNDYVIYIGRGECDKADYNSNLGNPYTVKDYGRDRAIQMYKDTLKDKQLIDLLNVVYEQLLQGKDIKLMCWCAPAPCHGDIIKTKLIKLLHQVSTHDITLNQSVYTITGVGDNGVGYLVNSLCELNGHNNINYFIGQRTPSYSPFGNTQMTELEVNAAKFALANAAHFMWGYKYSTMKEPSLLRYFAPVHHASQVIVFEQLVRKDTPVTGKMSDNRTYKRTFPRGSAGYAAAIGIGMQKPVYVFCNKVNKWYCWNYVTDFWDETEMPKLSKITCVVGAQHYCNYDIDALNNLFNQN